MHDDVIKWKHFPHYWQFVRGNSPVTSEFPRTKASDAGLWSFSFIYTWINSWINNGEAGNLRRHRAHYDVTVMKAANQVKQNKDTHRNQQRYSSIMKSLVTITVTSKWARWRLKSLTSRLFAQSFVQARSKENIKAPRHWPLWGEAAGERCIPLTKGQ